MSRLQILAACALGLAAAEAAGQEPGDLEADPAGCGDRAMLYDPSATADPDSRRTPGAFLLGLSLPGAWLPDIPVGFVPSGDACLGPVPVWRVATVGTRAAARDTHALARRLAPRLAAWSAQTGMEACARMCQTPGGAVVAQVVTLRSHISCAAPPNTCPEGAHALAETIHSHPPRTAFVANAVDAVGWNEPGIAGRLTMAGNPNMLSPEDRVQAPVWLVTGAGRLVWLETPEGQEVERP